MILDDRVIIIGAGIGGLVTGALLSKRGRKVTILEQSSGIGGCCKSFSRSGFRFDVGASFFPDILLSGLDQVLRELGLEIERIFSDPFYHLCIPGHRIGIYRNNHITKDEWAREFPTLCTDINKLFNHLFFVEKRIQDENGNMGDGILRKNKYLINALPVWEKWLYKWISAKRILTRAINHSPLLKALDLQTAFWGQTNFSKANLAFASMITALPQRGGFQIKGGSGILSSLLTKYILDKGGEIRLNSKVSEIILINDEVQGIKLENKSALEGGIFIANTTPWSLYNHLLPKDKKTEKMIKALSKIPDPKGVFTLFLGVKSDCLPSEMGQEVLFLPDEINREPIFISVSPEKDTQRAPQGYRAMTAFQYTQANRWQKEKKIYMTQKQQKVETFISELKRLLPFLEEGLCFYEAATPITYERYTARPNGIVKGIPQFCSLYDNRALSEFTCYNNIYIIGDCISPSMGVEGVCRTALRLVNWIAKKYD